MPLILAPAKADGTVTESIEDVKDVSSTRVELLFKYTLPISTPLYVTVSPETLT